jgi:TPR repeat protein
MSFKIDDGLKAGMELLKDGKKIDKALELINKSARKGTTKGKSFFEVGRVIREGVPGLQPNVEESRKYYDAALGHFYHESCDSMDHREMGDYFYYGLGTEPVNFNRALEYYDMAAKDGDEEAAQKAIEIRKAQAAGSSDNAPVLNPTTVAKVEEKPVASPAKEAVHVVVVAEVKPAEVKPAEVKPVEAKPVEVKPAEAVKPAETPVVPAVVQAPAVTDNSKTIPVADAAVSEEIDADSLLLKAIRILDNPASSEPDKLDAVSLADIASEQGSLRAAVLMGYLHEGKNAVLKADFDSAKRYYDLAIERGSSSAEFRLGMLYTNAGTSFYNEDKGHSLILDSARNGYSYALNYLGDCFRAKVMDSRNLDVAYRYYALAGERGLGLAYHNMAEIDSSRQQLTLAKEHEQYANANGFDSTTGSQDPLYYSLHV